MRQVIASCQNLFSLKSSSGAFRLLLLLMLLSLAVGHFVIISPSVNAVSEYYSYLYLDCEHCFPAYYSSFLLFLAALFLMRIALQDFKLAERSLRERSSTALLALAFFYLTFDEALRIHEQLALYLPEALRLDAAKGVSAWLAMGLAFTFLSGLVALPFIFCFARSVRRLLVFSASIFLAGAVGCEAVSFLHPAIEERWQYAYRALAGYEELLEIAGISLFLAVIVEIPAKLIPQDDISRTRESMRHIVEGLGLMVLILLPALLLLSV